MELPGKEVPTIEEKIRIIHPADIKEIKIIKVAFSNAPQEEKFALSA